MRNAGGTCRHSQTPYLLYHTKPEKARERRKNNRTMAYVKKTDNPNYSRRTTPPKVSELKIRLSVEDEVIISRVMEKYDLRTKAEAIRLGIRALDKER